MPPLTATANDEVMLTSWVHISDIHFGHGDAGHQWDQPLVLDDLRRDIREVLSRGTVPPPRHVFLTGDVAFSGGARPPAAGATEYGLARVWLDRLLADLELERDRLFVVPGNHDVDRAMDLDVKGMLKHARAHEPDFRLDELLGKPEQVGRLTRRMARFLEFANSYGPADTERFHGGLWWVHRGELEAGVSLRICGLNTATLSVDDTDQGRLRIGNRQLNDLLMPAPDALEVVLVLGHHPPTDKWLADEKTVRGRLDAVAAVHLFGHLHEAGSSQMLRGAGGGSLQIAAGAAHAEAAAPGAPPVGHGYNFGALVMLPGGKLVARIWPRTWTSDPPRFVSHSHIIDDARGYAEHPLRHVVPRPSQPAPSGPHPHPGPLAIQADQLLGQRYLLKTKLGEGGVGQVWKALDTRAGNEPVALKILNPTGAPSPPARRQAFLRGPRSMARVDHPAIVHIRDPEPNPAHALGPHDYYVMDLVNGQDLSRTYKGKPRSDEQTITLMIAIAEGLAAAHANHLIHRDLKPSNVLVDVDGNIKIVDFDTVKDLRDPTQTRTSERMVSDLYAAPEVLDGATGSETESAIDARADIYSLAVTGIFLRSGRDPPKTSMNRMHVAVAGLPCSDGLRKVLGKACAFERDHRHASIAYLLTDLRVLQGYEDPTSWSGHSVADRQLPAKHRRKESVVEDDDDRKMTLKAVTNKPIPSPATEIAPVTSTAPSDPITTETAAPPFANVEVVDLDRTVHRGPPEVAYPPASPIWTALVDAIAAAWSNMVDNPIYRAMFVAAAFLVLSLSMSLLYPVQSNPRGVLITNAREMFFVRQSALAEKAIADKGAPGAPATPQPAADVSETVAVAPTPDPGMPEPGATNSAATAAGAVGQLPVPVAAPTANPWLGPAVTGKPEDGDDWSAVTIIPSQDGSYWLQVKNGVCEISGSLKLTDAGEPAALEILKGCSWIGLSYSYKNISKTLKFNCSTMGRYRTCSGLYRQRETKTGHSASDESTVVSDYLRLRRRVPSVN